MASSFSPLNFLVFVFLPVFISKALFSASFLSFHPLTSFLCISFLGFLLPQHSCSSALCFKPFTMFHPLIAESFLFLDMWLLSPCGQSRRRMNFLSTPGLSHIWEPGQGERGKGICLHGRDGDVRAGRLVTHRQLIKLLNVSRISGARFLAVRKENYKRGKRKWTQWFWIGFGRMDMQTCFFQYLWIM